MSMIVYSVKDWNENFEKADTRRCKEMKWVPLPNKHDGKGYRRLMAQPDATDLFAAWVLIVQVASKCPVRGVLEDEDGPLTSEDLFLKTGLPAAVFNRAFDFFCRPKIGWLVREEKA